MDMAKINRLKKFAEGGKVRKFSTGDEMPSYTSLADQITLTPDQEALLE
jgi:hypothetical protein